jgi:malonyl-CoA/methylmalonyl-CoA synthetase
MLFPELRQPSDRPALRVGDDEVSHTRLAGSAARLATELAGCDRVAVWAENTIATGVATVAALIAGVPAIPVNPKSGSRELEHILGDCRPAAVLCGDDSKLPAGFDGLRRIAVTGDGGDAADLPPEPPAEAAALIVYTSGTTGPPKGAVLPRRAIASNLDALATAWGWSGSDVVCHALPLFHVHGLVLGTLGPIRRGGTSWHLGGFSAEAVAGALADEATMLFAVPTMYHRLADAAETDPAIAAGLGGARLLVSGSAPLPAAEHQRLTRLTGQRVIERYGMSETLMIASTTVTGERRGGSVGEPLDGVEVSVRDDLGAELEPGDDAIGEVHVRGQNVMLGYLNRPEATAAAFTADGFFRTGDLAVRSADGYITLVGRRATDLIKSGGFKIGAGEIESALLDHPAVAEAAVAGVPDADLGERVCAWVVLRPDAAVTAPELTNHVAATLSPHKRPRSVWMVDSLPRNAMGKVLKTELRNRV